MAITFRDKSEELNVITRKKVLIMTLGNARDVDGLVSLLHSEEDIMVKTQIVTVLGALGKTSVIHVLIEQIEREEDKELIFHIKNAIEVIRDMTGYNR